MRVASTAWAANPVPVIRSLATHAWTRLAAFTRGDDIDRDACAHAARRMHERDPVGDRVHLVCACAAMIMICGPVSVVEWSVAPLAACLLVRAARTFPLWIHGFGQPSVLAMLMLAAWAGVTLLWSEDPRLGAEHIGQLRWILLVGLVYPVIEHRGLLVASLCAGFVLGHGAQVIDGFNGLGSPWLADALWHEPRRISGWWDPSVGGSMLVAALGLHLPPAVGGRGRIRALGMVGATLAGVGLIATGTRGAWIAGALLVGVCAAWRVWTARRAWRTLAPTLAGAAAVLALGAVLVGDRAMDRIEEARVELAAARSGDLDSSTGARVSMAVRAAEAGLERPIVGIGAGSFPEWMERTPSTLDDAAHAHNTVLHWLAETGVIGVALLALFGAALLVGAHRNAEPGRRWTHDAGPLWALLGLGLVSAFGTLTIDLNTMALIGALAALCPAWSLAISRPSCP